MEIEQEGEDGSLVTKFNDQFASMDSAPLPPPNHDPLQIQSQYAPVPLPAAFWLLGSGLAGLLALRRRPKDSA